jgi:hypothetical protein
VIGSISVISKSLSCGAGLVYHVTRCYSHMIHGRFFCRHYFRIATKLNRDSFHQILHNEHAVRILICTLHLANEKNLSWVVRDLDIGLDTGECKCKIQSSIELSKTDNMVGTNKQGSCTSQY